MTMWKRWIQRGVLCSLVLGGLVGFATIASAAEGMPSITDHAAMAAWYDKEAANLRQHEKDMAVMKEEYRKNPNLIHQKTGEGMTHKMDPVQHCESLVKYYGKAAEEAETLAGGHRSMVK
jgi:hypothetical protein